MVIIFQSEKARSFLLENGFVYTFRVHRRKRTGRDWMTDKRGGRKIADVFIEEIGCFRPTGLLPYVEYSGFDSYREWQEEIVALNRNVYPNRGWLYKITLFWRKNRG